MTSNSIRALCLCTAAMLVGCASSPASIRLQAYNGLVTTGGDGARFEQVPMTTIPQKNNLFVITHVRWESPDEDAGIHTVCWKWYSGGKLVAERDQDMRFRKSPFETRWRLPASDFDPGHYRVDVAIDGSVVDSHEYDIVP